MIAWPRIEEHASRLVQTLHANRVTSPNLLLLEVDDVAVGVPHAEPFGLFRHDDIVFEPHPRAKILHTQQALPFRLIFVLAFVVEFGQKGRLFVIAIQIPPRSVVITRRNPSLYVEELGKVANHVICHRTPPVHAVFVD